jgi:hypothetical protein
LPLDLMLDIIADPATSPERRDKFIIAAAPYCHARLSVVGQMRLPSEMSDSELIELIARTEADIARRDGQPWPRLAIDNNGR